MPISAPTPALTKDRPPSRRLPARRWPALVLSAVGAAALSAACSTGSGTQSGPGGAPVASLAVHGGTPAAAAQIPSVAQSDQDFVNFARCMRAHGVQIRDPFHISGHSGLSIEMPTRDAATSAAYGACNHFIAQIIQAKTSGAASQAVADPPPLTRWAQCQRHPGIPLPDPEAPRQV